MTREQFIKEVKLELNALKEIGVKVPKAAFNKTSKIDDGMVESMSVTEAADFVIAISI